MNIKAIINRYLSNLYSYYTNKNNTRDYSIWIFGEWFGAKCSDNVMCFANYMASHFEEYTLYWICNEKCNTDLLNKKIKILKKDSLEAIQVQKIAGVAIMNQGFDDFASNGNNYLGNAITVNLWHGVMWKKIGFDVYNQKNMLIKLYIETIKKAKQYKMFLSPSEQYAKIFKKAFRIPNSKPIFAGLPRNEILYISDEVEMAKQEIKEKIKLEMGESYSSNIKIITYMPTFRDKMSPSFSFSNLMSDQQFLKLLEDNNAVIIQKAHEANLRRGEGINSGHFKRLINMQNVQPQLLLAASDILITDYSSCFFDFLITERPIIFYIYDYIYYSTKDRGIYFPKEAILCGECPENEKALIMSLKNVFENDQYYEKRNQIREKYLTFESKNNCQMIYDAIKKEIETYNN